MPSYAYLCPPCLPMPTYACLCLPMATHAYLCLPMLTYCRPCLPMLHLCLPMLPYAYRLRVLGGTTFERGFWEPRGTSWGMKKAAFREARLSDARQ